MLHHQFKTIKLLIKIIRCSDKNVVFAFLNFLFTWTKTKPYSAFLDLTAVFWVCLCFAFIFLVHAKLLLMNLSIPNRTSFTWMVIWCCSLQSLVQRRFVNSAQFALEMRIQIPSRRVYYWMDSIFQSVFPAFVQVDVKKTMQICQSNLQSWWVILIKVYMPKASILNDPSTW